MSTTGGILLIVFSVLLIIAAVVEVRAARHNRPPRLLGILLSRTGLGPGRPGYRAVIGGSIFGGVVALAFGILVLLAIDRVEVLTVSALTESHSPHHGPEYTMIDSRDRSYNLSGSLYGMLREGDRYRCEVQTYLIPLTPTLLSCTKEPSA